MKDFTYEEPVRIHFGSNMMSKLPEELQRYGNRVLLVYGGGSVKRSGLYEKIMTLLNANGFQIWELSGISSNPKIESVRLGADICRKNKIDVVLAVGGGSVIDCSKVITAATFYDGDAWDIVKDSRKIKNALPLITIITISATGSEMNNGAVITNEEKHDKRDTASSVTYPRCSFLDPVNTYTVNAFQTAAGTADIMSHIMEVYFSREPGYAQNRLSEALMKTCIECGKRAIEKPDDYEARASLMWAAVWGINALISGGKTDDWSCHEIEHAIGGFYDVSHGAALAVITPRWMRYILNNSTVPKFAEYGVNVFGINADLPKYEIAELAIDATEKLFFECFALPSKLSDFGVTEEHFEEIAADAASRGIHRSYVPLFKEDVMNILLACM